MTQAIQKQTNGERMEETPQPEEKEKPTPHEELKAFLSENGITADQFLPYGERNGHFAERLSSIDEIPETRVKLLLMWRRKKP